MTSEIKIQWKLFNGKGWRLKLTMVVV